MDVFAIREMLRLYDKGSEYYSYTYYQDWQNRRIIFLEFNIMCEAQYLYRYELKEDKGVFLLIVSDHVDVGEPFDSSPGTNCEVAGHTESEAVDYMIKKILHSPPPNKEAGIDIEELKRILQASLLSEAA